MSDRHVRRYAAYKESGVEWLGEVPGLWALQRHKDCFYFIADRCSDSTFLKVGLENIEGKTGRFITTETEFDGDGIQFKKDDILFGKLRPYLAKVYLAEFRGNSVGDIFVYRCKRNTLPKFARYLMLSDLYIDIINSSTAGAKMPRVSSGFITDLPVAMPSIAEQAEIIFYLDTKTAQVDRQIELLSKKATQYGKLKQSLINETVTRGLDSSVPMKKSGVEWIGDVPAHWDVKRVKEVFEISRGRVIAQTELVDDGLYPVYSSQTKDGGCLGFINTFDYDGEYITWTTDGVNAGTVFLRSGKFNCTNICGTLKHKKRDADISYLFYSLYVTTKHNKRIDTNGAKIMSNEMMFIKFCIPPLPEQSAIAAYLDTKTAQIDRIVSTINTQIDKLKELRKTLINDVVTGKIKVITEGELA